MDNLEIYWQNPANRQRFLVGYLKKIDDTYSFAYSSDVINNKIIGFTPIYPFLNYEKEYKSTSMFSSFLNRIPSPKREDIDKILKKYGLEEYDEFNLLKRSGGRTPADNLEFVVPIDTSKNIIATEFYVAGVSHCDFCSNGCPRENLVKLKNVLVKYEKESDNEFDEYAVKLMVNDRKIGYVPKYYSKSITQLIDNHYAIKLEIVDITNIDSNCRECVKIRLFATKES